MSSPPDDEPSPRSPSTARSGNAVPESEVAAMFDAIARDLSAALVQVARAAPERDLQKSGLGERLTALFDRKN